MKLRMTVAYVFEKLREFLREKGMTNIPTEYGRGFEDHQVVVWNWSEHIEDGYLRANAMNVKISYLSGVVLLISVRSGAGWIPNTKDQEYVLKYLEPLIKRFGIGAPEEIYIKSVGTRSGNANVLNLKWCDQEFKSLVAAINRVFGEQPL